LKWAAFIPALLALAMAAEAQVRLVSTKEANGSREAATPAAPGYEDRLIEGLQPLDDEEAAAARYDRAGLPRHLRFETRLGKQPFDDRDFDAGVSVLGAIDTPNHGVLSVDANYGGRDVRGYVTLRQRALPVDGGWLANNELGVLTPLAPEIMRLPSRVFMPTLVTRGAGSEWINRGSQLQFIATAGQLGRLQGYSVPGFLPLSGNIATVAAQGSIADWRLAARHAQADEISLVDNPSTPSDFISGPSTHVTARRDAGNYTLQGNAIATRTTDGPGTRYGAWVDGEWRRGNEIYGAGAYRLEPNLSWAGQPMASDIEGVYVDANLNTRRMDAQGSLDVLRPVSGSGDTGILVTASGQWRYSRTLTLGLGGSARRYNGDAGSAYADAQWRNDWGDTAVRAQYFRSASDEQTQRVTLDHTWYSGIGASLSAGVSLGREATPGRSGTIWGAAASFTAPVLANATLMGNVMTDRRPEGNSTTSANVSLTWPLTHHWSLEGNFVYTRGQQRPPLPLDPLAPIPDRLLVLADSTSFFVVLRYEDQAGSRAVALGGTPLSGGGSIEGTVYLDANRNGTQEAAEKGAANVTVYLDGRYAARTDSLGRFTFPFVAPGSRVITVVNETLPLPWEVGSRADTRIEVVIRETTRVEIPVERRGAD